MNPVTFCKKALHRGDAHFLPRCLRDAADPCACQRPSCHRVARQNPRRAAPRHVGESRCRRPPALRPEFTGKSRARLRRLWLQGRPRSHPRGTGKGRSQSRRGDDRGTIQTAIDQVGAMPADANGTRGAILLTAGEYQLSSTLNLNKSGVVLRGEGATCERPIRANTRWSIWRGADPAPRSATRPRASLTITSPLALAALTSPITASSCSSLARRRGSTR